MFVNPDLKLTSKLVDNFIRKNSYKYNLAKRLIKSKHILKYDKF